MTKEEAIAFFKDMNECTYGNLEAIDMAIEALKQQPCEDCISRQAVDELSKQLVHTTRDKADFLCNFWEGLQKLPSVTPKEKTGHWRHYEGMLTCSECGTEFYDDIMEYCGDGVPKCCPNCGTRMEVKNE